MAIATAVSAQTYYNGITIVTDYPYQIEVWDYDQNIKGFRWINNNEVAPPIAKEINKWKKKNEIFCTVPYGYAFNIRFIEEIGLEKRYTYLILRGGFQIDDKGQIQDEELIMNTIILDGEKYSAGALIPRPDYDK